MTVVQAGKRIIMSTTSAVLVLLVLLPLMGALAQPAPKPPTWPARFTATFNETAYLPVKRTTVGTWYYDPASGVELVVRANGRGDRYCGSIHPFSNTPCSQLVAGGVRYLIFPDLGTCCKCCTADHGCGVLTPSWLDNANYEGPQFLNGLEVDKWRVKGLQPNDAYFIRGTQTPVEVDQLPNDYIFLQPGTFNTDPIDPNIFQVPASCDSLKACPFFSTCTVARGFTTL